MSRGPDAGTLLARALLAAAQCAGCAATVADSDWTHWASATFAGARHVLRLRAESAPVLDAWLGGLPDAELTLRGHLVADLTVTRVDRYEGESIVTVEAVTVEER